MSKAEQVRAAFAEMRKCLAAIDALRKLGKNADAEKLMLEYAEKYMSFLKEV